MAPTARGRGRLAAGGFDDLPGSGPFVLGGLADQGGTLAALVCELGVGRQAASPLVDRLVLRGYLTRSVDDDDDRRRVNVELTERGHAAAAAVREGVVIVDGTLAELIPAEELEGLYTGLDALRTIRERQEGLS